MEKQELYWKYYESELQQAINHEKARENITNFILVISGIIVSLMVYDDKLQRTDLLLSLSLVILGIFGMIFNAKYYERFTFHYSRAKKYRNLLEEQIINFDLQILRENVFESNSKRFGIIADIRLNWLWLALNLLISLFGIILTIIIIS